MSVLNYQELLEELTALLGDRPKLTVFLYLYSEDGKLRKKRQQIGITKSLKKFKGQPKDIAKKFAGLVAKVEAA